MTSRDDDRFRVRPGPPKARQSSGGQRFVSRVLREANKAGAKPSTKPSRVGARSAAKLGRGHVAAQTAGRNLGPGVRRVVIKARYVVLKQAGVRSVETHLRYIEREGVDRNGGKGRAYDPTTDHADLAEFEERGRGDRHQFRFIVSPEDAQQLKDLRGYTRHLMTRMEGDLGSSLDWVAVDHWNTDNPHTHIVLRGRDQTGHDLIIARDYIAHGMRLRASELATEWLGPRTEREISEGLLGEVDKQRLTGLDRALIRQADTHGVDLAADPRDHQRQNILPARLQRLEGLGLAKRIDANRWELQPGLAATLNAMGERRDASDTMHRALKGQQRELVLYGDSVQSVVGRIAGKGLADELNEKGYLVVDGVDGRAYYLKLPADTDIGELPIGGIVEARRAGQDNAADRNILAASKDGIYTPVVHLARLAQANARDPQDTVDAHVRRLEALRRSGVVERIGEGVWKIPDNLLHKARQHDAQKGAVRGIELRSQLPVEQQVRAIGATWLDRCLLSDGRIANQGFGAEVREALQQRMDFLVGQGLAERQGQRVIFARNLLATLRDRELALMGKALQEQTGKAYCPLQDGQRISGVCRRSLQLNSGRFVVFDSGPGFSLVPWRPFIEQRLGQHLSAVVRGGSVSWNVNRQRGIGL